MCGIVAVVDRPDRRPAPAPQDLLARLDGAMSVLARAEVHAPELQTASAQLTAVDRALQGAPGVLALVADPELVAAVTARLARMEAAVSGVEAHLESHDDDAPPEAVEELNAALVSTKDALWAIRHDRLRAAREVVELAGRDAPPSSLVGFSAVQVALSAIDRLEVRGRDSAGLQVFVWDHGLDVDSPSVRAAPRRPGIGPALHVRFAASRRRNARLRLQGGSRDRRARRQHRGTAGRHARGRLAACRAGGPDLPRSACSATPAGRVSASSPSRMPIRSTRRRKAGRRGRTSPPS